MQTPPPKELKSILFLDDCPSRAKDFRRRLSKAAPGQTATIVTTAAECIAELDGKAWDEVHLDHDLEGTYCDPAGDNTGMEVVRWVAANPQNVSVELFIVHTLNDFVWRDMVRGLMRAGFAVRRRAFKLFD